MCAQYSINAPLEKIISYYDVSFNGDPIFKSSDRVFPKQGLPILVQENTSKGIELVHWGLKPAWMAKMGKSRELINVRADSLLAKPNMRKYLSCRCLIPATGFYEWKTEDNGKKTLYHFVKAKNDIFSMAGVVSLNQDNNQIESFAIVTTEPNEFVKPIHNRMPLILSKDEEIKWMSNNQNEAAQLLAIYPIRVDLENFAISNI